MISTDGVQGEPQEYTVRRDGDRNLKFRGWAVGSGSHGTGGNSGYECDWNRGVDVAIYLTTGGSAIATWRYWSQWQGEDTRADAQVSDSPNALLSGLLDSSGELRRAEKDAWEEACAHVPAFAALQNEVVD